MNQPSRFVFLSCSLLAATAHADEGVSTSPSPTPPAPSEQSSSPAAEDGVAAHFMVELGVGTTFMARGVPQFSQKDSFAVLNGVLITLDNLGPGSLTFGTFHEAALTDPELASGSGGVSPQFDPIVSYGFKTGRVRASVGYFLHLWPAWVDNIDGQHEIQVTAAVEGLPVRPAVEVDVEFVRMYGAYANASVSKTLTSGAVSVTPSVLVGVHGYDQPFQGMFDLPFALREATAAVQVGWKLSKPFYVVGRAAYSYTGIKNWWMEDSFLGRSTPSLTVALGATN